MKVLHLAFTYYPDPPGGTEVYVEGLVRQLADLGITSVVAAPSERNEDECYESRGHRVYRYPAPAVKDLRAIFGEGSPEATASVARIIATEAPDIVHMHALTHGVPALIAGHVRTVGVAVVYTYHTPTATCQRGTLMRYGVTPCDGRVLVTRCSACLAQQHGAGATSWAFALVPPPVGRVLKRLGLRGKPWNALRLTELMTVRKQAVAELFTNATTVVAVSEWVRELLLRNKLPSEKIVLSRQGTEAEVQPREGGVRPPGPLRMVMLGRMDPVKGLGLLLDALALVPDLGCELDVYAVTQKVPGAAEREMRERVARDPRVRIRPPFPSTEAAQVIGKYDVLLVPSQWMETGPLVVLEAFAAGVPVVGSRLGGVTERVRHGVDGLLVDHHDPAAWAAVFSELAARPERLAQLAQGIASPKRMREVALEMQAVYTSALAASNVATARVAP